MPVRPRRAASESIDVTVLLDSLGASDSPDLGVPLRDSDRRKNALDHVIMAWAAVYDGPCAAPVAARTTPAAAVTEKKLVNITNMDGEFLHFRLRRPYTDHSDRVDDVYTSKSSIIINFYMFVWGKRL